MHGVSWSLELVGRSLSNILVNQIRLSLPQDRINSLRTKNRKMEKLV